VFDRKHDIKDVLVS